MVAPYILVNIHCHEMSVTPLYANHTAGSKSTDRDEPERQKVWQDSIGASAPIRTRRQDGKCTSTLAIRRLMLDRELSSESEE